MTTIEKIRAEIERLKKNENELIENSTKKYGAYPASSDIMLIAYQNVLSILSTLEESEKPMQEGLEEEYKDYVENDPVYGKLVNRIAGLSIARHFAQWGAEHTPLPEDTILFNKGVAEGKRLMMEDAVKWLVDDDYHEASEKGRFILGSVGLGYNGYYIPYLDLLKLPKED